LKQIKGVVEVSVAVVGGQKYWGVLHDDVKVSYVLKDKMSGNINYRCVKYFDPYVLKDGPNFGGPIIFAPIPPKEGVSMDIDIILKILKISLKDEDEYVLGFGNSTLGKAGFLLLDLEISLSKQYLYPKQLTRTIAF
jgi:hypothetical protein